jgi:hypothetical protein
MTFTNYIACAAVTCAAAVIYCAAYVIAAAYRAKTEYENDIVSRLVARRWSLIWLNGGMWCVMDEQSRTIAYDERWQLAITRATEGNPTTTEQSEKGKRRWTDHHGAVS